ncbi:MAG: hypothetical protein AABY42_03455 [Nitrospirota bacterium]
MRVISYFPVIITMLLLLAPAAANAQEESYNRAIDAYIKRDFRAAADHLKEYVAKKPEAEAYYLLGYSTYMLCRKSGQNIPSAKKEAEEYFREAYLIDPDFSPKNINFQKARK